MKVIRRTLRSYGALVANNVKIILAYSTWYWTSLLGQAVGVVILVYFWKGVYGSATSIAGIGENQALNYILLAQVLVPTVRSGLTLEMGGLLVQGTIGIEMLRPLDLQVRYFVQSLTFVVTGFLREGLPVALLGALVFGIHLPSDPRIWGAAALSMLLGMGTLFCFDWAFACLAFYTTESWGLHVLREGVATFFSGALIPLAMLPGWLRSVAVSLPFGQALYVPVSMLAGLTPVSQAPRIWMSQLLWLVGGALFSRLVFANAVRRVTVQGG
ncbi:MAG: ABC transporter permease [Mycobacterium leprae]